MVAAGLASLLVGALTLRLRADYLAITTFGVAISIQLVALNVEGLTGSPSASPSSGVPSRSRATRSSSTLPISRWWRRSSSSSFSGWSGWCGGRGAGFSVPFARMSRLPRLSARMPASLPPAGFRPWWRDHGPCRRHAGTSHRLHRPRQLPLRPDLSGLGNVFRVGSAGNNRGAVLGAVVVWGLWSSSSALIAAVVPAADQGAAAALQIVMIGVLLAVILVLRPRGLLGER